MRGTGKTMVEYKSEKFPRKGMRAVVVIFLQRKIEIWKDGGRDRRGNGPKIFRSFADPIWFCQEATRVLVVLSGDRCLRLCQLSHVGEAIITSQVN